MPRWPRSTLIKIFLVTPELSASASWVRPLSVRNALIFAPTAAQCPSHSARRCGSTLFLLIGTATSTHATSKIVCPPWSALPVAMFMPPADSRASRKAGMSTPPSAGHASALKRSVSHYRYKLTHLSIRDAVGPCRRSRSAAARTANKIRFSHKFWRGWRLEGNAAGSVSGSHVVVQQDVVAITQPTFDGPRDRAPKKRCERGGR